MVREGVIDAPRAAAFTMNSHALLIARSMYLRRLHYCLNATVKSGVPLGDIQVIESDLSNGVGCSEAVLKRKTTCDEGVDCS